MSETDKKFIERMRLHCATQGDIVRIGQSNMDRLFAIADRVFAADIAVLRPIIRAEALEEVIQILAGRDDLIDAVQFRYIVAALRAGLNAWPGVTTTSWFENNMRKAVLNIPLPKEAGDE